MKGKQALIEWIPKERGGRTKPPTGVGSPCYSTVVRFVDGVESWPADEAWSLVVVKQREIGSEYHWLAEVHFLVPEAPHETIREGRTFELREGDKTVARGRIIVRQDVDAVLAGANDTHV